MQTWTTNKVKKLKTVETIDLVCEIFWEMPWKNNEKNPWVAIVPRQFPYKYKITAYIFGFDI